MAKLNLFGFLKESFSEDNGNPSSMRIVTILVVGVVLFNWTWFNIQSGTLTGFGYEELIALLGPLGLKAYQKGSEAPANEESK